MKSVISRTLLLSLAGMSISSFSVSAQNSMPVPISGEITADSCTATVSGLNSGTLVLPGRTMSEINTGGPSVPTIPETKITFSVGTCTENNMWAHFTTTNMVENGRVNTSHDQIQFQFLDVNNAGTVGAQVDVGGMAGTTGPTGNQGTGVALAGGNKSKSYAVRYYRKTTVTHVGAVTASVTYTIKYY